MLTSLLLALLLSPAPHGVPPVTPLRVLHAWSPVGRYAAGDRGVDLAGAPGQRVVSATAGVVTFAGAVGGRGVVSVTLADGRRVTYEPLVVAVARGAAVSPGTPIGRLAPGWPGCAAAACLHWGLASGHGSSLAYADPMSLLGALRVRLLPLDDPVPGAAPAATRAATPAPARAGPGTGPAPVAPLLAAPAAGLLGAVGGLRWRRRRRPAG